MLVIFILLVIISILFQKLNRFNGRQYLRNHEGFEVLNNNKPKDSDKYIELVDEKNKLSNIIELKKDKLSGIKDIYEKNITRYEIMEGMLREITIRYNDIKNAIDNVSNLPNREFIFKESLSIFNMKRRLDLYYISTTREIATNIGTIYELYKFYCKMKKYG